MEAVSSHVEEMRVTTSLDGISLNSWPDSVDNSPWAIRLGKSSGVLLYRETTVLDTPLNYIKACSRQTQVKSISKGTTYFSLLTQ